MKENDIKDGFWVFVSHSTKDFEKVRLVRNALEESGFRPILLSSIQVRTVRSELYQNTATDVRNSRFVIY